MENNKIIRENLLVNGQFNIGKYKFPLCDIDFRKARKPFGIFSSNFIKNVRLKEWQAFQAGDKRFFILIALYNAKTMAIVRLIIYDKESKEKLFYEKIVFPRSIKLPLSILEGKGEYLSENFIVETKYLPSESEIKISIAIKKFRKLPDINLWLTANYNPEKEESISACIPFGKNTAMYSHKGLCNAQGFLKISEENFSLQRNNSFLIFDDHKGFYPSPMIYDWLMGAKCENGVNSGFNLTDNQSVEPEKYNENCIWENGKTYFLPRVKFFRPKGSDKEWIIKDSDGYVKLRFTPIDKNPFKINLLFMKADYEGPLGIINGTIKSGDRVFEIDNYFGMGEKKYIRG